MRQAEKQCSMDNLYLLYDWYTKACNNPNRWLQISCVIAQFETRLNRFLKKGASNVVLMENRSNKIISYWSTSTGDKEGEIFPNFELLPCFNIDVQP